MTQHTKDIAVLNTLTATLFDSIDGYEKAAADVQNPRFAQQFADRARERREVLAALRAAVVAAGGTPEDDGTLAGAAHRVFINLKEAVLGNDDEAIINEVERGEDYLKNKFSTAIENVDLGATARAAVQAAWISVKRGHDEVSALKHRAET